MTMIKVNCPQCGDIDLGPTALHLTVFDAGPMSHYEFFCTKCFTCVRKPADSSVQTLLTQGGVASSYEHVPREVLEMRAGAPITYDDVLEFTMALEAASDTALDAASAPRRPSGESTTGCLGRPAG